MGVFVNDLPFVKHCHVIQHNILDNILKDELVV